MRRLLLLVSFLSLVPQLSEASVSIYYHCTGENFVIQGWIVPTLDSSYPLSTSGQMWITEVERSAKEPVNTPFTNSISSQPVSTSGEVHHTTNYPQQFGMNLEFELKYKDGAVEPYQLELDFINQDESALIIPNTSPTETKFEKIVRTLYPTLRIPMNCRN